MTNFFPLNSRLKLRSTLMSRIFTKRTSWSSWLTPPSWAKRSVLQKAVLVNVD